MMTFDAYFYLFVILAVVLAVWTFHIGKHRFALRWYINLVGAGWVAVAVFMAGAWWLSASGIMAQILGPNAVKVGFSAPMNATIIAMSWYFIAIQLPGFIRLLKNRRP